MCVRVEGLGLRLDNCISRILFLEHCQIVVGILFYSVLQSKTESFVCLILSQICISQISFIVAERKWESMKRNPNFLNHLFLKLYNNSHDFTVHDSIIHVMIYCIQTMKQHMSQLLFCVDLIEPFSHLV